MTKAELLKYNPRKEFRKELTAFFAFGLVVMVPITWLVVEQLSK